MNLNELLVYFEYKYEETSHTCQKTDKPSSIYQNILSTQEVCLFDDTDKALLASKVKSFQRHPPQNLKQIKLCAMYRLIEYYVKIGSDNELRDMDAMNNLDTLFTILEEHNTPPQVMQAFVECFISHQEQLNYHLPLLDLFIKEYKTSKSLIRSCSIVMNSSFLSKRALFLQVFLAYADQPMETHSWSTMLLRELTKYFIQDLPEHTRYTNYFDFLSHATFFKESVLQSAVQSNTFQTPQGMMDFLQDRPPVNPHHPENFLSLIFTQYEPNYDPSNIHTLDCTFWILNHFPSGTMCIAMLNQMQDIHSFEDLGAYILDCPVHSNLLNENRYFEGQDLFASPELGHLALRAFCADENFHMRTNDQFFQGFFQSYRDSSTSCMHWSNAFFTFRALWEEHFCQNSYPHLSLQCVLSDKEPYKGLQHQPIPTLLASLIDMWKQSPDSIPCPLYHFFGIMYSHTTIDFSPIFQHIANTKDMVAAEALLDNQAILCEYKDSLYLLDGVVETLWEKLFIKNVHSPVSQKYLENYLEFFLQRARCEEDFEKTIHSLHKLYERIESIETQDKESLQSNAKAILSSQVFYLLSSEQLQIFIENNLNFWVNLGQTTLSLLHEIQALSDEEQAMKASIEMVLDLLEMKKLRDKKFTPVIQIDFEQANETKPPYLCRLNLEKFAHESFVPPFVFHNTLKQKYTSANLIERMDGLIHKIQEASAQELVTFLNQFERSEANTNSEGKKDVQMCVNFLNDSHLKSSTFLHNWIDNPKENSNRTGYKIQKMMEHLSTLDRQEHGFGPLEECLYAWSLSIQNCPAGITNAIDTICLGLNLPIITDDDSLENFMRAHLIRCVESVSGNKDFLEKLVAGETLFGARDLVHIEKYMQQKLKIMLGAQDIPEWDEYSNFVPTNYMQLEMSKILEVFCEFFGPKLLSELKKAIDENLNLRFDATQKSHSHEITERLDNLLEFQSLEKKVTLEYDEDDKCSISLQAVYVLLHKLNFLLPHQKRKRDDHGDDLTPPHKK